MIRGSWVRNPGAQAAKYWAISAIAVKNNFAYLADLVLRQVFLVVVIFVFAQLWLVTYRSTGSHVISGFSIEQMLWYLVLTESITMGQVRAASAMDSEVKTGQIAYTLSRPYSFLLYHYASYIGETMVRIPVNIVIGGALALVTVGPLGAGAASFAAGIAAAVLGTSLHFLVSASIGLLAFWFEDTASFYLLYSRIVMLLGGMMLPLDLFPEGVRRVAKALPTSLMIYEPARLFTGQVQPGAVWDVLARQGFWLAVFSIVLSLVYRQGVKRTSVQGG